jgi:DHA3 family tetracycline resistance protein-like MFS transporter
VRGAQAGQVGAFAGILAGAALGSLRINLPIVLGGGLFWALGLFLIARMPEHKFRPAPSEGRHTFGRMWDTARGGVGLVRTRPILYSILGVSLFYGLFSEGFDRLTTALFVREIGLPSFAGLQPVAWIGLIDAGALLLGAAATEIARRRVDAASRTAPVWALMISNGLMAGALIALGLTHSFAVALAMSWMIMPLRELAEPFHMAWLNRQLESSVRATAISLDSQLHALGEILGGLGAGAIATAVSLRAAIAASGAVLTPSVLLTALALRAERDAAAARQVALPADTV